MRRVAAFQAMRADGTPELYERVRSLVSAWVADKFGEVEGATVVRRSGRPAQHDLGEERLGKQVRLRLTTLEEVRTGRASGSRPPRGCS